MCYINRFFSDEDGVEIIEWIAILSVTAVLIGIVASTGSSVIDKLKGIAKAI